MLKQFILNDDHPNIIKPTLQHFLCQKLNKTCIQTFYNTYIINLTQKKPKNMRNKRTCAHLLN